MTALGECSSFLTFDVSTVLQVYENAVFPPHKHHRLADVPGVVWKKHPEQLYPQRSPHTLL